jgi:hypothetical protein
MHLYLRLVNKSGEPLVEQVPEVGFHYVEVGFDIGGPSEESDNPNVEGNPKSINPFLVL